MDPEDTSSDQTGLTRLLNDTIASANPDPLTNPRGVYWGDPERYGDPERRTGAIREHRLFRTADRSISLQGHLRGYGLLMRQQNDGFSPKIWRRPSRLSVLPATLWHNDIAAAGQLFPWLDASTYPVQTVFDPYAATHWQYYPTLVASYAVGETERFFPRSEALNLPSWNHGVFYAHDANASDYRAAPDFGRYRKDGEGGWEPRGGNNATPKRWILPNATASAAANPRRLLRDPRFSRSAWAAGQLAQGNPYANGPAGRRTSGNPLGRIGGGAGLHTNARIAYTPADLNSNARFLQQQGGAQRWTRYAGTYNWPRWPSFTSNRSFPGISDPTRFRVDSYFAGSGHFERDLLHPSWRRWLGEINDNLAGDDRSFAPWTTRFVAQLDRIVGPTDESRTWGWEWFADWGIAWVNNIPDMIRLQNQLWLQRRNWKPQRDPYGIGLQSDDPQRQLLYDRTYWGWNELPMDADRITGEPLAFTLALPTGYSSMRELFDAADAFGPRILTEVYDAINSQIDWYCDPANASGFGFGENKLALARQVSDDGGVSYERQFFAESFSTDRYRFTFEPFRSPGSFASEGHLIVTPLETA